MMSIRYYPELATAELFAWARSKVGSYENSSGRLSCWLVQNEPLPEPLAIVAKAVCPERDPADFVKVALQCYEDGQAETPCHTDMGATGFGFILSLGATRTFRVHRVPEGAKATAGCGDFDLDVIEIECLAGTVILMDEDFHSRWHHLIPLEPEVKSERVSLVFRTQPSKRG